MITIRRPIRNMIFYLIIIIMIGAATEAFSYVCYLSLRDGYFAPQPGRIEYRRDLEKQYAAENFDPVLGWIPYKEDRDNIGARVSPNNPNSARACLSLYGDSFVFGDEVSAAAAWGNQLAKKLRCKVLNFGVSAYGTDQAYLRFVKNSSDNASVTVLAVQSENIVRNVNQNRAFLYSIGVGPLKPIFWLDHDGKLRLTPVPKLTDDSYGLYVEDPRRLFPKEFFIPDSSVYAEQRVRFPYSVGVLRALRYKRISDGLLYYVLGVPPWYSDLYNPRHYSNAFNVTASIIDHFVSAANDRKKIAIIMFIPGAREISYYLKEGKWVYASLYQRCLADGYNCFNAGPALLNEVGIANLRSEGICEFFCFHPLTLHGHYNEKGNKILARVFLKYAEKYLAKSE